MNLFTFFAMFYLEKFCIFFPCVTSLRYMNFKGSNYIQTSKILTLTFS